MLDRSHTANLFSENVQEASELAGAAHATVERPAASPDADVQEVQRVASPSTTAPRCARPRRPRPAGGGRRGAVPARPRVARTKPQLSLPRVPRRVRRALAFAPLVLVLVVLLANQAGCAHQVTPAQTHTSSAPPATHIAAGSHHAARPAPTGAAERSHPGTPSAAARVSLAQAPAASQGDDGHTVAAPAQQTAPVTATTPATPAAAAPPASPPAAPSSGNPSRRERGEADEFGFER
jgi:hypothetical protein